MADIVLEPGAAAPSAPRFAPVSASYGRYALTLLVAIYTVNFLDRQIITTIGESIKNDLHLTDTQMGALGGIFFAAVYTILGIPIARIADKSNRPWVMTISLALWSGFTVMSAFAKNYAVLAISRAGVGIGEAGCSPTAHSLLADYFPQEKRATALAIYSMGISIGTLLGMAIGGIVAEHYGWRTAFLVAGAPGLAFAVLAIFTLREPRSQLSRDAQAAANASSHIPLLMVFSALEMRPTFWLFALGGALTSFVSYAHGQFFTPFFLRNHAHELTVLAGQFGMAPAPGKPPLGFISLALGLGAGIGGAFGSWLGGALADRWGAKDVRNYALFPLLVPFVSIPVLWYAAGTDNMMLALILLLIPNIGVGAWWGPVYGGVQSLVPPAMRALSAAVLLFVINMIGLGGGPTAFGMMTDAMTNRGLIGSGLDVQACKAAVGAAKATCAAASAHGIKVTVYLSTAIIPLAMICFFLSRRTIGRDVANADALPAKAMSTRRLAGYLFVAGALPGAALANASSMFFKSPPPLFYLDGLVAGGAVGVILAVMIAAAGRRAEA
ncbi:spinster family MFS transporter [Phenylobacterium sp.]|uniref:spinster family MFS transporter n=1 Tax=Phenylobacterium sp. TaxID=1871053 RepID=UPI003561E135